MHHLDRPQGHITHDLYGKDNDGTPLICVPEDLEKLIGGVRSDA